MASPLVFTDSSNPSVSTPLKPLLPNKAVILVHHFRISSTGRRLPFRSSISRRQLITKTAAAVSIAPLIEVSDKLKQERPRFFDLEAKKMCWAKAESVPGRDPERWRKDAAGNIVGKRFHSCQGCLCFEYDHIIPFSKGGESIAENCQLLQTKVNRFKADKVEVDKMQLKGYSCGINFTDKELDIIEMGVYGDVMRPGKRCRVSTIDEMVGIYKSKNTIATCKSHL